MKALYTFLILSISLIFPIHTKVDDPVIYLRFSDSTSLDPGHTITQYNGEVVSNIFEGLVQYKKGSDKISPSLAVKWKIFDNGRQWRFFLRKDVYFHNGTLLTAKDIVYSFMSRIKHKDKKYPKWGLFFPYIKEVKEIDNLTVDIILERPFAPFLALLTDPVAYIVKRGSYEEGNFNPLGTGPFIFSSWIKGKHIILKKNRIYWEKRIRISRVIFKIIPNVFRRINMIKSGQAHVIEVRSGGDYSHFIGDRNVNVISNQSRGVFYLSFNTTRPPLNSVKVRKAFAHLINKDTLIHKIYNNFAIPATTPLPPNLKSFNKTIQNYPFDTNKAKNLLIKAGITSGFSCSITFLEDDPGELRIANTFVRNAKLIGINIQKKPSPFNKIWKDLNSGNYNIILRGGITAPDPDIYLYPAFAERNGKFNWTGYTDPELTTLLTKGRETFDENKRVSFYNRAQEILHRDVPWIPLMHLQFLMILHKSVKDVFINSNLFIIFKDAYRVE